MITKSLWIVVGALAFVAPLDVALGDDITGMKYRSTAKSPVPLVHLDGSYSYDPSVMQDADPGWKVWFCGGNDSGDDPANYATNGGDSIYYTVINIDNGGYFQPPKLVLRHTNNDGDEDGRHACSPSVIRHSNTKSAMAKTYISFITNVRAGSMIVQTT
jgi:hypothetical protein